MTCRLYNTHMCAHGERRGRSPRSPGPRSAACGRNVTAPISVASRAEGGRSRPETMPAQAAWLGGVSCTCQHQQGTSELPEQGAERAETGLHAGDAGASSARRTVAAAAAAAAAAATAAAAAAGWLAVCKHAAPERREGARSRRSGHIDTLNEEDLQAKKHTM